MSSGRLLVLAITFDSDGTLSLRISENIVRFSEKKFHDESMSQNHTRITCLNTAFVCVLFVSPQCVRTMGIFFFACHRRRTCSEDVFSEIIFQIWSPISGNLSSHIRGSNSIKPQSFVVLGSFVLKEFTSIRYEIYGYKKRFGVSLFRDRHPRCWLLNDSFSIVENEYQKWIRKSVQWARWWSSRR